MKLTELFVFCSVVLTLVVPGCSRTREPLRQRDDFFKPLTALPKRNRPVPAMTEIIQVNYQLESAANGTVIARDSLGRLNDSVLISKNSHADTVFHLGSTMALNDRGNATLQRGPAKLQVENKKSPPELGEIRPQVFASYANSAASIIVPAPASSLILNMYAEGLSFFKSRHYCEALNTFSRLLGNGVEEDIADNCEYWIGECHFARQEYAAAVTHFQKVLSIESSNKMVDAYFMLGRTYEQSGDRGNALGAYEELNRRYPNNEHAQRTAYHLDVLKRARRAY